MNEHREFKRMREIKQKTKVVQVLRYYRQRKDFLRRTEAELAQRRKKWLQILAVQNWKLFTSKHCEFKRDPIIY
jgi:hypothetical protein